MNILERADKFAEGKANEAITKAIAQAFVEGYKAGYHDREMEIPADLRDEKTEYKGDKTKCDKLSYSA